MAKGGSRRGGKKVDQTPWKSPAFLVTIGVLVVVVLAVVLLNSGGDGTVDRTHHPVSGFADIHGMAVHSSRPDELYVATHNGLIRAVNDTDWARVGASQDDYMGFSMHPTDGDVIWTSGHPRGGGNMGVRQSTDGGFTWRTLALDGVDLHALAVSRADPEVLYGSFQGSVYRSTNGGDDWDTITEGTFGGFSTHPTDADVVYATAADGVYRSTDAGVGWSRVIEGRTVLFQVDPHNATTWYRAGAQGLERTTDEGATWQPLGLEPSGALAYMAFHPTDRETFYVATLQTAIHKTTDGGATWTIIKSP